VLRLCLQILKIHRTKIKGQRNSPNLLGVVCTSKPEQQMPSAFHTPHEHNSSHKIKTDNT
jgi:hypothetical protein